MNRREKNMEAKQKLRVWPLQFGIISCNWIKLLLLQFELALIMLSATFQHISMFDVDIVAVGG